MQIASTTALSMQWVEGITWLFVVVNTGRLLAYIPQFISAWNCPNGAQSVSILTWGYFTLAHCTALLYALFVIKDSNTVWIFSGNLAVTLCLLALLICKRVKHKQAIELN